VYVSTDAEFSQHLSLAEASKRVPHGIVCLLSALHFHELTTQLPFEVWMAISQKAWMPQVDRPKMCFHRFSGAALESGIKTHVIEGIKVRVYNPPKTVVDCFKFRNKIGLDVAVEALKDCYRQRKANMDELWSYAQICRMSNVMKPYLEMLV
jgi:predicted transcriptional regulator of viral defense system